MLSYKHGFHAGNHADVLKHLTWLDIIQYLCRKETPFSLFDTHAGAGCYRLDSLETSKNKEYETGIASLFSLSTEQPLLRDYATICQPFWAQGQCVGSPLLAIESLRRGDEWSGYELHPSEFQALSELVAKRTVRGIQTRAWHTDGLAALPRYVPPKSNRGAVLIDPPYERLSEYSSVVACCDKLLRKWRSATVAVWYPLLSSRAGQKQQASAMLCQQICGAHSDWLRVEVALASPDSQAGMIGSGMLVINPPWQMVQRLQPALSAWATLNVELPLHVHVLTSDGT